MYNQKVKTEFYEHLISIDKTTDALDRLFSRTSEFEENFGKDVGSFTKSEFGEVLNSFTGTLYSVNSIYKLKSKLKTYVTWYAENVLQDTDSIDALELAIADSKRNKDSIEWSAIKTSLFASPVEFEKYIHEIFPNKYVGPIENADYIDCVEIVILWLMYIGIQNDEIFQIKDSDVDLSAWKIHLPAGRTIDIPEYCRRDIEKYVGVEVYIRSRRNAGSMENDVITKLNKCRCDTFIKRQKPNDENTKTHFYVKFCKFSKLHAEDNNITSWPTTRDIILSGAFYRIYESELKGIAPDTSECALLMSRKDDKTTNIVFNLQMRYMAQYKNWRSVYYPDAI